VDIDKLSLPDVGMGSLGSIADQATALSRLAEIGEQVAKLGTTGSAAAIAAGAAWQTDLAKSGALGILKGGTFDGVAGIAATAIKASGAAEAACALAEQMASRHFAIEESLALSCARLPDVVTAFGKTGLAAIAAQSALERTQAARELALDGLLGATCASLGASMGELATKSMSSIGAMAAIEAGSRAAKSSIAHAAALSALQDGSLSKASAIAHVQDAIERSRPRLSGFDVSLGRTAARADPWWMDIVTPPPLPAPIFVEPSDARVCELEDRVEALETMLPTLQEVTAERDALAAKNDVLMARCAALERQVRELRIRRRSEVLDASQEHTPEPPVNDSQFPDPRSN
jgi:hypothetical protein